MAAIASVPAPAPIDPRAEPKEDKQELSNWLSDAASHAFYHPIATVKVVTAVATLVMLSEPGILQGALQPIIGKSILGIPFSVASVLATVCGSAVCYNTAKTSLQDFARQIKENAIVASVGLGALYWTGMLPWMCNLTTTVAMNRYVMQGAFVGMIGNYARTCLTEATLKPKYACDNYNFAKGALLALPGVVQRTMPTVIQNAERYTAMSGALTAATFWLGLDQLGTIIGLATIVPAVCVASKHGFV